MLRRSKEQIKRDRERAWLILRDAWSFYGICKLCNKAALVRGKTKRSLKCKECFIG